MYESNNEWLERFNNCANCDPTVYLAKKKKPSFFRAKDITRTRGNKPEGNNSHQNRQPAASLTSFHTSLMDHATLLDWLVRADLCIPKL